MAMTPPPSGLQWYEKDKWKVERDVDIIGSMTVSVVGIRRTHYYSVPYDPTGANLVTLLLVEGLAMPDRPAGSTAVIESVTQIGKPDTARQIIEVIGLEAKGWS
jgi:hypothetical protein